MGTPVTHASSAASATELASVTDDGPDIRGPAGGVVATRQALTYLGVLGTI